MADGADVAAFCLVGLVGHDAGVVCCKAGFIRHDAGVVCGNTRVVCCNARLVSRRVGLLCDQLCGLQRFVGLPVRFNLDHQQIGLSVGLLLRDLPALVRQHQPPSHNACGNQQRHVSLQKARAQRGLR